MKMGMFFLCVLTKASYICAMQTQKKAYLLALLAVLFWSTMSSAFKLSLQFLAFDQLLFWSVVFAFIALTGIVSIRGQLKKVFLINKAEFLRSALMGLLNPFAYYLVLFKAYELLRAQEAGVLNYSWPVVLVILSALLLGQRIDLKGYISIFTSFFGLLVISTKGQLSSLHFESPLGVSLAIGSAFFWAMYWIINLKDRRESLPKITLNMGFGLFYITIYMLLFRGIEIPSVNGFLGAVYIGLFEMGITFVIWLMALKNSVNTAKVSNLIFLSPFLALFFIRAFVGEPILPSTVVGLILIVAGILLQQLRRRVKTREMV